jgi:hypothetical protein
MCKFQHERKELLLALDDVHVCRGGRTVLRGVDAVVRNVVRPTSRTRVR